MRCCACSRRSFDEVYSLCGDDPCAARQRIHRHLIELLDRAAARHDCATNDLASTLLFVAHKAGRFVAGHIGDGVIAQLEADGAPVTLSYPDNGEFANSTVFVTDPSALDKFRLFHGESDPNLIGFALMSDGCAESLYDKKTGRPATAIAKLLAWNRSFQGPRRMRSWPPTWSKLSRRRVQTIARWRC